MLQCVLASLGRTLSIFGKASRGEIHRVIAHIFH
jgi:hypothetical protein